MASSSQMCSAPSPPHLRRPLHHRLSAPSPPHLRYAVHHRLSAPSPPHLRCAKPPSTSAPWPSASAAGAAKFLIAARGHYIGSMRSSGAVPYTPYRGKSVSHSQQRPVLCLATLNSKCSAGQTQTVDRQTTSSTISITGPGITPKLEKGGEGGSPPYYGGGGGGGGGGGASSGGFFLFAFLLFLRFLRDLEKEETKEKREMVMVVEEEDTPITMEEDDW